MKTLRTRIALIMSLLLTLSAHVVIAANSTKPDSQTTDQWIAGQKRLGFQENKGQFESMDKSKADFVLFKAEVSNMNIWITTSGITYQFLKIEKQSEAEASNMPIRSHTKIEVPFSNRLVESYRVDMILKGASINASKVIAENDITVGKINFYHAHSPKGISEVHTYSKITIHDVYPGIDWQLYFANGVMEHDFIVHPFANAQLIQLNYEGAGELKVTDSAIQFKNEAGELTEGKLLVYQNNKSNVIHSNFTESRNTWLQYAGVGFSGVSNTNALKTSSTLFSANVAMNIGNYDRSQTLVIDPQIVWGTYFGGPSPEIPKSIACDNSGNVFVSGELFDIGFPVVQWGAGYYQSTFGGGLFDCFFMSFTNNGNLNWATYYGGAESDASNAAICDNNSHVFFTGYTVMEAGIPVSTFPTQPLAGAFNQQVAHLNSSNAFLLRFNALNGLLEWGTFIADGETRAMTFDNLGNLYITGSGAVNPGIIRPGAYNDTSFAGGFDILLLRFSSSGALTWATNYGGSDYEEGIDIAADESSNIYIVGSAHDSFPVFNNAGGFNYTSYTSLWGEGHIMRFTSAGVLTWASYCPGTEQTTNVLCNTAGEVYVTGYADTVSDGAMPIVNRAGAYNQAIYGGGDYDCVIMQFDANQVLKWSTYYGGKLMELIGNYSCGSEATIDACGNVTMSLSTMSINPVSIYTYSSCSQYSLGGNPLGSRTYLMKLTDTGVVSWGTLYGGNGAAGGWGFKLDLDKNDNLFVTKAVYEPIISWPLVDPGAGAFFDTVPDLQEDVYMAKFTPIAPAISQSQVNDSACSCGSATITVTCGEPNYDFAWSNGSTTYNTSDTISTISGLSPGTYTVTVTTTCHQNVSSTFTILGVAAGINETPLTNLFSVAPNPSSGNINVNLDASIKNARIEIYNSLGVLVESLNNVGQITTIDWSNQPAGVYYIQLLDESMNRGINKVVKM